MGTHWADTWWIGPKDERGWAILYYSKETTLLPIVDNKGNEQVRLHDLLAWHHHIGVDEGWCDNEYTYLDKSSRS